MYHVITQSMTVLPQDKLHYCVLGHGSTSGQILHIRLHALHLHVSLTGVGLRGFASTTESVRANRRGAGSEANSLAPQSLSLDNYARFSGVCFGKLESEIETPALAQTQRQRFWDVRALAGPVQQPPSAKLYFPLLTTPRHHPPTSDLIKTLRRSGITKCIQVDWRLQFGIPHPGTSHGISIALEGFYLAWPGKAHEITS
ncbi:hypothetical protein B0J18DRAFT_181804 [Chaetomium sp. MPI-SDFR-AT-0129]|nr:hypothetical protein B0J18DRAFT_181804 [Chaetomium sp. MPI-SDFR-AT-0129]